MTWQAEFAIRRLCGEQRMNLNEKSKIIWGVGVAWKVSRGEATVMGTRLEPESALKQRCRSFGEFIGAPFSVLIPLSVHWRHCSVDVADAVGCVLPLPGRCSRNALPSATSLSWFPTAACSPTVQMKFLITHCPSLVPKLALTSNFVLMTYCPTARWGLGLPLSSRPLFSQVWPSLHPPSYFLRPPTCASAPRSLLWSSSWPVLSSLNCNHTPLQHLLSVALGIGFACLRFFLLSSLDYTLLSSTVAHASETPALGTGPHSGLKCSVFIHQEKDNARCVVDLHTL